MGGKIFSKWGVYMYMHISFFTLERNLQNFTYPGLKKKWIPNSSKKKQQKKTTANSQFDDKYTDYKKWGIGR